MFHVLLTPTTFREGGSEFLEVRAMKEGEAEST